MSITQQERKTLRELAKRQAEIAALPVMGLRRALWHDLNGGKTEHPLIAMEFHGVESDVYPPLTCETPFVRGIERQLRHQIFKHENYWDDRVIPASFSVRIPNWFKPFGYEPKCVHAPGMAHSFEHAVHDLLDDFGVFKASEFGVDEGLRQANEQRSQVENIIGDILPVRLEFPAPSFCVSYPLVQMMGMETMFVSILDYPELFHQVMRRFTGDYLAFFDAIEAGGAAVPNNDQSYVGQDSYGYTHDLPGADGLDRPVKMSDLWGYGNSQETINISPSMFDEFFFTYIKEVADRFGLFAYGCCEPVHDLWEPCLSRLKNLRKLSVSPWCDEEFTGEALRGKKIVYHRKPFTNFFSVDPVFDEEAFLAHMEKTVKAARGCPLEITFRDICSVRGEPWRLTRAVELTREAFMRWWQG
ncbi:MAG: hypothetical protein FWF05_06630 [Oscillospiraceae bacterium]|nr:hypothetical protein [Oscillospiraceae bacterium]